MTNKLLVNFEIPTKFVELYLVRTSYILEELHKNKTELEIELPLSDLERDIMQMHLDIAQTIYNQCAEHIRIQRSKTEVFSEEVVQITDNIMKRITKHD